MAYVVVKAANSPRPGNWILERSLDGQIFTPWQYFAVTDDDCEKVYGVRPTIGVPTTLGDDQVICTSRYSRLDPLENGEVIQCTHKHMHAGIHTLMYLLSHMVGSRG